MSKSIVKIRVFHTSQSTSLNERDLNSAIIAKKPDKNRMNECVTLALFHRKPIYWFTPNTSLTYRAKELSEMTGWKTSLFAEEHEIWLHIDEIYTPKVYNTSIESAGLGVNGDQLATWYIDMVNKLSP